MLQPVILAPQRLGKVTPRDPRSGCRRILARLQATAWHAWRAAAGRTAAAAGAAAEARQGGLLTRALHSWAGQAASLQAGRAAANRLFRRAATHPHPHLSLPARNGSRHLTPPHLATLPTSTPRRSSPSCSSSPILGHLPSLSTPRLGPAASLLPRYAFPRGAPALKPAALSACPPATARPAWPLQPTGMRALESVNSWWCRLHTASGEIQARGRCPPLGFRVGAKPL